MKKLFLPILICLAITGCGKRNPLIGKVNTMIGTDASASEATNVFTKGSGSFGQVLPAVLEPNGMNFWTAQTRDTERKGVCPYYHCDTLLQGFRNSHWIVGGCTQDYGSMTLMPESGELVCDVRRRASAFSHEREISTPAYYSAELERYGIRAEMTGLSRTAIFRFTYTDPDEDAWLVINPNSDEGQGHIEIDPEKKEIRGYNPVHRIYQGKGEEAGFNGWFIIRLENEIEDYGTFQGDRMFRHQKEIGGEKHIGAFVRLRLSGKDMVQVKAASSFTGFSGAEKNMDSEIPHWNFDKTRKQVEEIWEKQLGKIQIEAENETAETQFYSALYLASFLPRTFNDIDGSYPSFGGGQQIMNAGKGQNYYDDFSMWDTYRALHPLLNIISPKKSGEMIQSLIDKYEQSGWLPIFPCWNSYTSEMIGDHCTSLICDAYCKGIRNFDLETAYRAMRQNAFELPEKETDYKDGKGRRALDSYIKYGYIPLEDKVQDAFHKKEQVSRTLEYAYDDYVLSALAKEIGEKEDAEILASRCRNYRNVIDPRTGYAQGRHADGRFLDEDNYKEFTSFITEGAPCHYTWYVPHDPYGLMDRMGGETAFEEKLDSMFTQNLYWHGNEPCHQISFMFNYTGKPWKSQKWVREIMKHEYSVSPRGLAGNDDSGQMSAWYLFAAMGFYPICPGSPYYAIASPSLKHVRIQLENGNTFTIEAPEASSENVYIQAVELNGKEYTRNYIRHDDILNGGTFTFKMGPEPNRSWGSRKEDRIPDLLK